VRRKAAVALGWLGNSYALDALEAALEDSAPDVQEAARAALVRIRAAQPRE
jgi:HEAT repeat protein